MRPDDRAELDDSHLDAPTEPGPEPLGQAFRTLGRVEGVHGNVHAVGALRQRGRRLDRSSSSRAIARVDVRTRSSGTM